MLQSLVVQIRTKLKENADTDNDLKSLRKTVVKRPQRVFFSDIAIIDVKAKNIDPIK